MSGLPQLAPSHAAIVAPMLDRACDAVSDALSSLGGDSSAAATEWCAWLRARRDELEGGLTLLGRHPERERWIRGLEAHT